jgi:hypothetical protein
MGTLRLWAHRDGVEMQVAVSTGQPESALDTQDGLEPLDPPSHRFSGLSGDVMLGARCADRPMVVRPSVPLTIVPGGSTEVFVSAPVWLTLHTGGNVVFEVPTVRPRNTWFGATPQAGELAYASRTSAVSRLADVSVSPGRAVTRLQLDNPLEDPWEVRRLKLPAPYLPLFLTDHGLWTPSLRIVGNAGDDVTVKVQDTPPDKVKVLMLLGDARQTGTPHLVRRALGGLSNLGWSA